MGGPRHAQKETARPNQDGKRHASAVTAGDHRAGAEDARRQNGPGTVRKMEKAVAGQRTLSAAQKT